MAATLPEKGVHATTDHRVLPPRILKVSSQCLGVGVPVGLHHVGLEPLQSVTSSPLGFSPDSASLAFSNLKPLFIVVLIHQQAPSSALGGGERGDDPGRDSQAPQHCVEGAESEGPGEAEGWERGSTASIFSASSGQHCLKCQVH